MAKLSLTKNGNSSGSNPQVSGSGFTEGEKVYLRLVSPGSAKTKVWDAVVGKDGTFISTCPFNCANGINYKCQVIGRDSKRKAIMMFRRVPSQKNLKAKPESKPKPKLDLDLEFPDVNILNGKPGDCCKDSPRPKDGQMTIQNITRSTLTVSSTNDSGSGTLRSALGVASFGDTILITASGTIILASPLPVINVSSLTITGPGANLLSIDGSGAYQVFSIQNAANVNISGMTLTNGLSTDTGGAVYIKDSTVTIDKCTISGSQANSGGGVGIIISQPGPHAVNITNCTISGNSTTSGGGGIYTFSSGDGAALSITNCTISGNKTSRLEGGIAAQSIQVTINNSTISGNQSPSGVGGFEIVPPPLITNTIVAGNTGSVPDVRNAVASGGYNLIGSSSGSSGWTGNDLLDVADAKLGPLQDNGGPTYTMALLCGSPAVDTGSAALTTVVLDQRGQPRVFNGKVDIGAFELQCAVPLFTLIPANDNTVNVNSGSCNWIADYTSYPAEAFSACGAVAIAYNPPTGTSLPQGLHQITVTATDCFSRTVSTHFNITVVDPTGPYITCPSSVNVCTADPGGKIVNFSISAVDGCGNSVQVFASPPSGSIFPIGPTSVTVNAGDTKTRIFVVTVTLGAPPALGNSNFTKVSNKSKIVSAPLALSGTPTTALYVCLAVSRNVTSVIDNIGNTYHLADQNTKRDITSQIWYADAIRRTSPVIVTAIFTGKANATMEVVEIKNSLAPNSLDATSSSSFRNPTITVNVPSTEVNEIALVSAAVITGDNCRDDDSSEDDSRVVTTLSQDFSTVSPVQLLGSSFINDFAGVAATRALPVASLGTSLVVNITHPDKNCAFWVACGVSIRGQCPN